MSGAVSVLGGPAPKRVRNRRGEGGQLRGDIVEAAVRLVDETGGAQAVTLRAVAREAGITPMSIYAHFSDRDAILAEVLKQTLHELVGALTARDEELADPVERLLARCSAYVDFAREWPQRHALFDSVSHRTLAPQEAKGAFGVFVSGVSDCVAAGLSRSTDPFADATAVWVAVHGYGTLRANHPDFPWPDTEQAWIEAIVRRLARISRDKDGSS